MVAMGAQGLLVVCIALGVRLEQYLSPNAAMNVAVGLAWLGKGCIAIVLFDLFLSTLVFPKEGLCILKSFELREAKDAPLEADAKLREYLENVPRASQMYMRVVGVLVFLMVVIVVRI